MNPKCLLDLDGFLVDFSGGALDYYGAYIHPSDLRWDFPSQIGFSGADDPAFWAPLGRKFWASLGWTREGRQALEVAAGIFGQDNIALVSTPCETVGCRDGKYDWVLRHCPELAGALFLGRSKERLCSPTAVLVDDRDENCERFAAAGGLTLLVPRPWNKRRGECDQSGGFDVSLFADELATAYGKARDLAQCVRTLCEALR